MPGLWPSGKLQDKDVSRIGGRDVHDKVLLLSQQVEPALQMMTDLAMLLQPLQARVVYVLPAGLVGR